MTRRESSKRTRRAFTAEFKLEAVRLMQARRASGVPLTQIGRELDVRPDQLRAWARRAVQLGERSPRDVFPGNGQQPSLEAEVQRLQRELAVVRQEREFLKKATAFFARESR